MSRIPANSSLTQDAYERLRADLLACRLRPGARLRINDLCQALSVSLSAVREALSRLTSEGLVVAEPQRGFHAAPISAAELRDLTGVRTQIEGLCLERAIAAGDVGWEAELVAAYHRLSRTPEREAGDAQRMNEAWSATHAAFHAALVQGCDSPWLLRLRETLYAQSERYRRLSVSMAGVARDLGREHQDIMDAVLAHDAGRAKSLMAEHLERTTRVLLEQSWPVDAPNDLAEDQVPRPDPPVQHRASAPNTGADARQARKVRRPARAVSEG